MISATAPPNATADELVHGWISTNCGRGTIDILWNCLFTIFLCVWTAIHLPVPCHDQERPDSLRAKIVKSRIGPSLITLIAPELFSVVAVEEFVIARRISLQMKKVVGNDFTLTHAYFFLMGGFCLESPSGRRHQLRPKDVEKLERDAVVPNWISGLQLVKKAQIKDMAKSDTLTKVVACSQALWLVTQVGSRLSQNKALTLLEVSTMAYVLCAIIMYGAWWDKPQDCTSPIIIACSEDTLEEVSSSAYVYHKEWDELIWAGRDLLPMPASNRRAINGSILLIPVVFGAIHVASWNITLPSQLESRMWPVSTLYCLVGPIIIYLFSFYLNHDFISDNTFPFFCFTLVIGYIIVRIFMLVEIFISLRALPASAFESVNWSGFIPHI